MGQGTIQAENVPKPSNGVKDKPKPDDKKKKKPWWKFWS